MTHAMNPIEGKKIIMPKEEFLNQRLQAARRNRKMGERQRARGFSHSDLGRVF